MSATVHDYITFIFLCQVVFYLHFVLFSVEAALCLWYNIQNTFPGSGTFAKRGLPHPLLFFGGTNEARRHIYGRLLQMQSRSGRMGSDPRLSRH